MRAAFERRPPSSAPASAELLGFWARSLARVPLVRFIKVSVSRVAKSRLAHSICSAERSRAGRHRGRQARSWRGQGHASARGEDSVSATRLWYCSCTVRCSHLADGVPEVRACYSEGEWYVMVMQLLGISLSDLLMEYDLNLKAILILADQMVHRDAPISR